MFLYIFYVKMIYSVYMDEKKQKTASMNLKLPDELYQAAKKRAKNSGITLSQAVRLLLAEWVRNPQQRLEV